MKYEHTPRPDTENHYHIRELIERQEKRTEDRNYTRDKQKERDERDNDIKSVKYTDIIDYWCSDCAKDFRAISIKQVQKDWNIDQNIAFYKTKCDCGKWCIRHITDKHKDSYFIKSRMLAKDRGVHHVDTLQPWQTGFNTLYKKI